MKPAKTALGVLLFGLLLAVLPYTGQRLIKAIQSFLEPKAGVADQNPAWQALAECLRLRGKSRPFEARLAEGFPYRPYDPDAAPVLNPPNRMALLKAEQQIKLGAEGGEDAEWLAAQGVVRLIHGRTAEALAHLQKAASLSPRAAHLNNLAVAYLQASSSSGSAYDLALAIESIEKALSVEPRLPEALFNKALILRQLHLKALARSAWLEYVEQDGASPWGNEARKGLKDLQEAEAEPGWQSIDVLKIEREALADLVERFPYRARLHVSGPLLGQWAEALLSGDHRRAARYLEAARKIAAQLFANSGDALLKESVQHLSQLDGSDPFALRAAALGHAAYSRGIQHLNSVDLGPAGISLSEAEKKLRAAGSPFAWWAAVNLAVHSYFSKQYPTALRHLEDIEARTRKTSYHSLRARVFWLLGISQSRTGDSMAALRCYRETERLFLRAGEHEQVAATQRLLANTFMLTERKRQGWALWLKGFSPVSGAPDLRRRAAFLEDASIYAEQQGHPLAALLFWQEAFFLAQESQQSWHQASLLPWKAHALVELGRPDEARETLAQSRQFLGRIQSASQRAGIENDLRLAQGETLTDSEPQLAIEILEPLIPFYEEKDSQIDVLRCRLALGKAYRSSGDPLRAMAELEKGIQLEEKGYSKLDGPGLRAGFASKMQHLYDEAVSLLADSERMEEAFQWSMRAKRQNFSVWAPAPNAAGKASPQKPGLEDFQKGLAPSQGLAAYSVLPDRLIIWVISRDSSHWVQHAHPRPEIDALVERYLQAVSSGSAADTGLEAAVRLYELLIQPVEDYIADRNLVIVPEKSLLRIPFSALINPATSQYLAQEFQTVIAPTGRPGNFGKTLISPGIFNGKALCVGNPRLDRSLLPELGDLPEAEREAEQICSFFGPGSAVLTGSQATKEAIRLNSGEASVILFAGHGQSGQVPGLLLAPTQDDSGLLNPEQILRLPLERTRLAALSACRTAEGSRENPQGVLGIAQAFLEAGVPLVAANLWAVEDQMSSAIMTAFFENLRHGLKAPSALRKAQLDLIGSNQPVPGNTWGWASVQLFVLN